MPSMIDDSARMINVGTASDEPTALRRGAAQAARRHLPLTSRQEAAEARRTRDAIGAARLVGAGRRARASPANQLAVAVGDAVEARARKLKVSVVPLAVIVESAAVGKRDVPIAGERARAEIHRRVGFAVAVGVAEQLIGRADAVAGDPL